MIELLIELKLDQYIETFEDEGIDDVKTFNDYEDEDLLELGLKKPHIKRLRRYFEESSEVKEVSVESNDPWFLKIANDTTIWNLQLLESDIPIISHEYLRIKALMQEGQYFGVLLQIKDFFEILLKVPILIVLNDKFNSTDYSEAERNFILATLEKPLSLGHWHELASFIKKHTLHNSSVISSLVNNIFKLYNKNNIIKWRNDEIGHGALSLDDDQEFQDDIKAKLLILKKFLDDNFDLISTINFDTESKIVSYGESQCSFIPFFKEVDKKIYFFDSYLSRKQKVHQLNYCFGKKLISEIPDFDNFISSYEMTKREEQLSTCDIEEVRLAEEEKQLDILESSTEFLKPNYLVDWMKSCLSNYDKGKFLLQMQRGTGKSLFCKALDQLALNEIELHDDILVRSFYINDVYRNSLGDFASEISFFILNKKLESKNIVDVFKGNIPNISIDSNSKDFSNLLSWYKNRYDVEKLLLIIDGIDEITQSDDKTIFDILPELEDLNEGIYILVTSRIDEEITKFSQDNLKNTNFQDNLAIKKDSLENIEILKNYINKYKMATCESQIEDLISKSDYRLLYLNMLKEIILSTNVNFEDIPSNEQIIDFYLQEVKKKYGDKYFQTIFNILIILASQLEELTIQEIASLNNDSKVNLKLIANLFDLRGFIKKTRSESGNKFSLNHITITQYINEKYQNEIIEYLKNSYQNIHGFSNHDAADIYKMAYLQLYENTYNISLSNNIESKQVLDFLITINNCEKHKEVKIALFLYKIDINQFLIYIDAIKKMNKLYLLLDILYKLKSFGDTQNTIKLIELIIDKFDSNSEEYLKLYETLCDMTHLEGEYEKAAELLEELVNTVERNLGKDSNLYVKYSIRIAHHRMFFSDIDLPWNRIFKLSNDIDQNKYKNEYAEILFMLGGNLAALKGNFKEGIKYLEKSIELGKKIDDRYLLSRCMRKISDYYRFYDDMGKANIFCSQGIEYTDDEIIDRQRIYLYATQAENYRKTGDYERSVKYFEECKKYALDNNIKGWVANSILGLNETLRLKKDNKLNSNESLMEALEIYKKINMNWGIIHTKIALALNNADLNKELLKEAYILAKNSMYTKDIKYVEELLNFDTVDDLPKKLYYHELMFL